LAESKSANTGGDPQWYKDAVIYELHIKSFADANGDGIGDFEGLLEKLDYLERLGVTAIWLLPFYPSPLRDDGYDISDYKSINPDYGDMKQFRRFVREAHKRGLRVITELVINHTSDQHPWFQKARAAKKGSAARNFYVWNDDDERFPTPFRHEDGSTAYVFSSIHPRTVDRHFAWMAEYGIDGAFVQRFGVHGARPRRDYRSLKFENRKLALCRDAAIRHSRCWVLMYDLSGLRDGDFERLADDWKQLRRRMQLGTDPNDSAYLRVNGKPLVAIWGVGFSDDRAYGLESAERFIRLLKHNPDWGGMSIMLGVPYHWREQTRDAVDDPKLHDVLRLADVLSPWSISRYHNAQRDAEKILAHQRADRAWCKKYGIEYLPVLWPGFSWRNMKGDDSHVVPRRGGRFLWRQFQATAMSGGHSAYIAMFDEMDEGTAIFKCTNNPPVGASSFQTYEGLPSDHYLWLCGEGRRLLRGELPSR